MALTTEEKTALAEEANGWMAQAGEAGITLTPRDFTVFEGGLYLDGMDPGEWIDAMTMD